MEAFGNDSKGLVEFGQIGFLIKFGGNEINTLCLR